MARLQQLAKPVRPVQNVEHEYSHEEQRLKAAYERRKIWVDPTLYSHSNPARLFMLQERERDFLRLLKRHGRDRFGEQKILEVGCGNGHVPRQLVEWGAQPENVAGIDLLPEFIDEARRLCPSGVALHCGNAVNLPFSDSTFDLVVQVTAFSSVLDPQLKNAMAREMCRVLKLDGCILWYDFFYDNPKNPDVKGVGRKEICELFPGCLIQLERVTLAPPLVRRLAGFCWPLCHCLAALRLLNTHYLGLIFKQPCSSP